MMWAMWQGQVVSLHIAREKGVPVPVQLRLAVARHDDRDGVVELVVGSRAHRLEVLAEQREVHDLHGARGPARRVAQEGGDPVDDGAGTSMAA